MRVNPPFIVVGAGGHHRPPVHFTFPSPSPLIEKERDGDFGERGVPLPLSPKHHRQNETTPATEREETLRS